MLNLIDFIKNNPNNWEELLGQKPYSLSIKRDDEYILFMYNQIESDFSNSIVQESRGIILDNDFNVVCFPFKKFFNVQEENAVEIDWDTAKVQEKLDGSIIKLWFHNGWRVSTNGTINARKAELQMSFSDYRYYKRIENYYDLFMLAFVNWDMGGFLETLDKGCTYIFELCSPFNKVVVPFDRTVVFHTGTRNNLTGEELNVSIGIPKPKQYSLYSLEDCLNSVEELPFNDEGYVVVDDNWNRVKIKSPAYVAAHHLKNNGVITQNRILDMIRSNGQDDFLSFYPEYAVSIRELEDSIIRLINELNKALDEYPETETRRDFAMWASTTICPSFFFAVYDNKVVSTKDWIFSLSNERLLLLIEKVN